MTNKETISGASAIDEIVEGTSKTPVEKKNEQSMHLKFNTGVGCTIGAMADYLDILQKGSVNNSKPFGRYCIHYSIDGTDPGYPEAHVYIKFDSAVEVSIDFSMNTFHQAWFGRVTAAQTEINCLLNIFNSPRVTDINIV